MRKPLSAALMIALFGTVLAACGEAGDDLDGSAGDGGQSDSRDGGGDAGGDVTAAPKYTTIVIYDKEVAPACTGSGPGADIDAVELLTGSTVVGVGKIGSAAWALRPTGATPCTMCSGMTCAHSGTAAAARIEGPRDGRSYAAMADTGYIALNTAIVSVQIGDPTGAGMAQLISSGQTVRVHEVDQIYKDDGSAYPGCACAPENYEVWAFIDPLIPATAVQLMATKYDPKNASVCGAAPSTKDGCGTTEFKVP